MAFPPRLIADIAKAGTTRRLLSAAMASHGIDPGDQAIRAEVQRIKELRAARAGRRIQDPLERARTLRPVQAERLRERRKRQAAIAPLLRSPMAAFWREGAAQAVADAFDVDTARHRAIAATLEAVTRVATSRWGFVRRHTSKSSGAADSRYLTLAGYGQVRVSDHEIPVYGERAFRYAENGGPRWGEVIVDDDSLAWTPTRWRRELILRAAGRR